jgi:tripartite tricarboxylate transporter TctB family protein
MRLSGAALFSGALAAIAAYAVLTALKWPAKAALFPLTMGIPLLVLAAAQTIVELRDPPLVDRVGRRGLAVFAWMGGFIALVLLGGFPAAVPIFVFLYLKTESGERWWLAIALALAAWGFFHLLFERLLHFPFEPGLIQEWFQ